MGFGSKRWETTSRPQVLVDFSFYPKALQWGTRYFWAIAPCWDEEMPHWREVMKTARSSRGASRGYTKSQSWRQPGCLRGSCKLSTFEIWCSAKRSGWSCICWRYFQQTLALSKPSRWISCFWILHMAVPIQGFAVASAESGDFAYLDQSWVAGLSAGLRLRSWMNTNHWRKVWTRPLLQQNDAPRFLLDVDIFLGPTWHTQNHQKPGFCT